jgi:hypothetical protein
MASQELKTLFDEYNQLVTTTLENPAQINTNLTQIQAKNVEIANKLNQLIQDSAMSGSTDPSVENARQDLIQKLNRIQRDYNGLIQNSDKLETLRRIRSFKADSSQSELQLYLFVFLFLGLVVIVVLMFKRQNADTAPAIPSNPSTMAAFT